MSRVSLLSWVIESILSAGGNKGEGGDDVIYVHDGANLIFHERLYASAGTDAVSYDILDRVYQKEVDLLA